MIRLLCYMPIYQKQFSKKKKKINNVKSNKKKCDYKVK